MNESNSEPLRKQERTQKPRNGNVLNLGYNAKQSMANYVNRYKWIAYCTVRVETSNYIIISAPVPEYVSHPHSDPRIRG